MKNQQTRRHSQSPFQIFVVQVGTVLMTVVVSTRRLQLSSAVIFNKITSSTRLKCIYDDIYKKKKKITESVYMILSQIIRNEYRSFPRSVYRVDTVFTKKSLGAFTTGFAICSLLVVKTRIKQQSSVSPPHRCRRAQSMWMGHTTLCRYRRIARYVYWVVIKSINKKCVRLDAKTSSGIHFCFLFLVFTP